MAYCGRHLFPFINTAPAPNLIHRLLIVPRLLKSGMALVLVEGEEKLPRIFGASNSKSPPFNGTVTSNNSGPSIKYVSSAGFIMCIATLLAIVL